ncbi:F5/8 type C domain-containing protein [Luteibacter sp. UNCMF331Sha3.1]|uniref:discoidin domain-containing protein n=1 Tax=Luteibacter sp. UNCMF331Sha3.1 TaxID=1502760 RepID=UPI0008CE8A0C|nr:discoidin domain-containing protein [Luteibacter sp. UNCMF331Sha3.1]SEM50614.1 F5/8 type C domain-containing protein [Luteibacter sp. UNCMF331Sha3.1]
MQARPFPRSTRLALVLASLLASPVFAADGLPPRDGWQASSSSQQVPALAPAKGIDGDETTRWGGAFSPGHWFQADLGKVSNVGGVRIHWDSGFAAAYSIQTSIDGKDFHPVYTVTDSPGGTEYLVFPATKARYVRLAAPARTADWGVSVFEFEPFSADQAARIAGLDGKDDGATLWADGTSRGIAGKGPKGARQLDIALPHPIDIAGLEVSWDGPRDGATLEGRDAQGHWSTLDSDPGSVGDTSYLAARASRPLTALRLVVGAKGNATPRVKRLRFLGPLRVMTAMKRYQIAASRENAALFPSSLHMQQVYWTAVGVPAGLQKSIFDEYGNLEPFKGGPQIQAIWRDASGRTAVSDGAERRHALRDRWKPMPSVAWTVQPGLTMTSEAIAVEGNGQPVVLLRHRLRNEGATTIDGTLSLVVRPIQINPPWQNGGPSPIHDIAIQGDGAHTDVRVDGRSLLASLTPVDAAGAAPFGDHGETEITAQVAAGTVPDAREAHDADGLAAGLLDYRVHLAPGEQRDVVVAVPLGNAPADAKGHLPEPPPVDRTALTADGFDRAADRVSAAWQKRLGGVGLSLPDESLVDILRSQAAYMLVNQTGHAMQAGPRNYNRSFIRDGAATASILLRMGEVKTARDYLDWYAAHAVHENGLVSPILNADGTVNTGFGSDIEYDSQGEFINLVADVARFGGGPASVKNYLPKVSAAMHFMQALRERTMVPGYLADLPRPERFHGIIAPSISHEGYSSPTHSYWDDYWALKGWHDGAWLAEQWGDKALASYAREQYAALRESLRKSIEATMAWKGVDTIPAAADLGDGDPTSVSIALDPAGQMDVLPHKALVTTFDRYLADVRKRKAPGELYAYTPYELRNVLTYVYLNRPADAQELLTDVVGDRRPPEWNMWAEVVHSRLRHPGYLGDMPHTWIGSEYARTIFGMLMREADDGLYLLPGTPPSWVAGKGLAISRLPVAYGTLTMTARRDGKTFTVTLDKGIAAGTAMRVFWPDRVKPVTVTVDGTAVTDWDADGVRLVKPFHRLVAEY